MGLSLHIVISLAVKQIDFLCDSEVIVLSGVATNEKSKGRVEVRFGTWVENWRTGFSNNKRRKMRMTWKDIPYIFSNSTIRILHLRSKVYLFEVSFST